MDESEISAALQAMRAHKGRDGAAALATSILEEELNRLEWSPRAGATIVLVALDVGTPTKPLLEAVCTYLWLYFQELDAAIAYCRELILQNGSGAFEEARAFLMEHIKNIDWEG